MLSFVEDHELSFFLSTSTSAHVTPICPLCFYLSFALAMPVDTMESRSSPERKGRRRRKPKLVKKTSKMDLLEPQQSVPNNSTKGMPYSAVLKGYSCYCCSPKRLLVYFILQHQLYPNTSFHSVAAAPY